MIRYYWTSIVLGNTDESTNRVIVSKIGYSKKIKNIK